MSSRGVSSTGIERTTSLASVVRRESISRHLISMLLKPDALVRIAAEKMVSKCSQCVGSPSNFGRSTVIGAARDVGLGVESVGLADGEGSTAAVISVCIAVTPSRRLFMIALTYSSSENGEALTVRLATSNLKALKDSWKWALMVRWWQGAFAVRQSTEYPCARLPAYYGGS